MAIPTAVGSVSCLIPPKDQAGHDQWRLDFDECMKMPGAEAIEKLPHWGVDDWI